MKVLYVYADSPKEWNCSGWNCIQPTDAINRTKKHTANAIHINDFIKNNEDTQKKCTQADIIVIERNFFGDTLTMVQFWKSRNKTVIAIFDDAYDIMHPKNVSYPFWTFGQVTGKNKKGKPTKAIMQPKPIEQFRWGMRMVKGIQVVSVNLAKDWSKYNKTYHVRNYLDIKKYLNVEQLYPHDKEIIIGWCGSLSHRPSFTDSGIVTALENIEKKYKNVKILISGDKGIYDLLNVENKIFQKFVPAEQWTPLLKTLDIGLAPLSGEYDKRRSWIKALEYMAVKVPWIATNYITYDELQDYGTITENGYKNWENAISKVLDNYPKYKEIANTTAFNFAKAQDIDKNIEKVTLALYRDIINDTYL